MDYQADGRAIWAAVPVGDHCLLLYARGLRREPSGVHGQLSVGLGDDPRSAELLAYDRLNIDRDRDRVHLANSAHRALSPALQRAIPAAAIRAAIDDYCRGAWRAWLSAIPIVEVSGDPDATPAKWLLEPWLLEGAGTILYGPPGLGKSYTALLFAAALDAGLTAAGRVPFGRVHRQARVLYVDLERGLRSLRPRIARVNEALGLPPHRPLLCLSARGRSLADVAERVEQVVADRHIGLVVVDSLSRAGFGSLVDDEVANRLMDVLNGWGVAWLALAHTPKAARDRPEAQTAFGSQMQEAAADLMVRLSSVRDELPHAALTICLEVTKSNDTPRASLYLTYEFGPDGLRRVKRAETTEVALAASHAGRTTDAILAHLAGGPLTAAELAQLLGEVPEGDTRSADWRRRHRVDVQRATGRLRPVLARLERRGAVTRLRTDPATGETVWALRAAD